MPDSPLLKLVTNTTDWRRYIAKELARSLDMEFFGVKGIYLFGSTESGDTGIGSDIDIILYVDSSPQQRELLLQWLDGWNQALCRFNYLLTGHQAKLMLDAHLIDQSDINQKSSYAARLFSLYEPVEALRA